MSGKSWWRNLIGRFASRGTARSGGGRAAESTVEFVPNELHRLRVGVATTVGSVRPHNEDNFYVPGREAVGGTLSELDASYDFSIHEADGNLFIVADGMGGQLAGEKASQMAVEIIPQEVRKRLSASEERVGNVSHAIRDAVATANQEILGLSLIQPEFSKMGTTVVLAYFLERHVYIAGLGDSRVYRLRDGKLTQLTKDHSLADALLEAGTITEEELPNHRFKHMLYLYLGSKDARSGPQDVRDEEIRVGDRYLLSSDGLTGYVGDDQLARMLQEIDDPREAARRLVSTALDHYSKDNITCMVIDAV